MIRANKFWVRALWAGHISLAIGGIQDGALAAPLQNSSIVSSWTNLPLDGLKQKPFTAAQRTDDTQPSTPLPAEPPDAESLPADSLEEEPPLDIPSDVIEDSPVLQRWLDEIPNVQNDIRNDPAFRTRIRASYGVIDEESGFQVGIEDVFLGDTGLTLNADYQGTFEGDRELYGADLQYYALPLGSVVNLAPVVGYRRLNVEADEFDGLHAGLRAVLALSRTGAADLALIQSWIAPGTDDEVGLTTLSVGYAVSDRLRLSTDIQAQNSTQGKDTRFGIGLEWML